MVPWSLVMLLRRYGEFSNSILRMGCDISIRSEYSSTSAKVYGVSYMGELETKEVIPTNLVGQSRVPDTFSSQVVEEE